MIVQIGAIAFQGKPHVFGKDWQKSVNRARAVGAGGSELLRNPDTAEQNKKYIAAMP
jgi:hypothetical protein